MKTYLNVPYKDKELAKAAGARFDRVWCKWFIEGTDVPDDLKHYQSTTIEDATSINLFVPLSDAGRTNMAKTHTADILVCDEIKTCPLAKSGVCISVHGSSGTAKCPCARCTRLTQSRSDTGFADRIRQMDAYRRLEPARDIHFAYVGSKWAYMRTSWAHVKFDPDRTTEKQNVFSSAITRSVSDPDFVLVDTDGGDIIVERDRITPELLHEFVCLRPSSWGKYVRGFTFDFAPLLLDEVRRVDADLMARYDTMFGKPARPNFVGRTALVATCAKGATWKTEHGTLTLLEDKTDGLTLKSDDWSDLMVSIPGMRKISGVTMSIPVTHGMTIEITDNSQVCEDTMFR